MDYYLQNDNVVNRLLEEYETHQSIVVAYDFDNTVFDYHQKGLQFHKVIDLLRELKKINNYLIVFTANEDEAFVKQYLIDNDIPFDAINENPPFYSSNSRKIYYNMLLDDRAGLLQCYDNLHQLLHIIKNK